MRGARVERAMAEKRSRTFKVMTTLENGLSRQLDIAHLALFELHTSVNEPRIYRATMCRWVTESSLSFGTSVAEP